MTMTAEQIRKQRKQDEERQSGSGGTSFVKISSGEEALIRIGPPWKRDGEFWKDRFLHGIFQNEVYCAQNDIDKKSGKRRSCKVCKRFEEVKGDRSPIGKKLWQILRQRSQGLWNAAKVEKYDKEGSHYVVRRYEDNRFKILQLAPTWHGQLLDIFGDDDLREHSLLGIADPKVGRLVKISRRGKGREDTEYSFRAVTTESPIFKDRDKRKKMEKTIVNLDKLVRGSSDEEIEAFLHKAERLAKKMVKEEERKSGSSSRSGSQSSSSSRSRSRSGSGSGSRSASKSASGSASPSASHSGSGSATSSGSASGSGSGEGGLEDRYREMKERSHKRHHH